MTNWRPVDFIVLILAIAISLALLFSAFGPLFLGAPLSDARSKILASVVSALVAVISVYVGAKMKSKQDD